MKFGLTEPEAVDTYGELDDVRSKFAKSILMKFGLTEPEAVDTYGELGDVRSKFAKLQV